MLLHEQIKNGIKEAMMAHDQVALDTYRGMVSAFTNELVAKGKKPNEILGDEEVITVITRLSKQRKDSIEQFTKGNRPELAEKETAELKILEAYLPASMPVEEIRKIAIAKKTEMNVSDKSKLGILVGAVMKECKGAADGAEVKKVVESLFD